MEEITKSGVRALVEAGDERALLALFDKDPSRVRRFLTRLTRAADDPCHARAIGSFQTLSQERSERMPEFFLEIVRRCLWEMNEEGGNVAWSAPEVAGAVIAGSPARYGRFFSYLFYAAVDEPTFQPSLLAAFERVSAADPSLTRGFEEQVRVLREAL
ncbi:hypothetical protein C1878_10730 [Gordonibacter sp. 28C]|uniref:hypothetical protein n=1 Tax=Gordonibacter sp. 28C TaxID=2078569 RepID=UPI000DF72F85|nr:hypothetical protein [Gordonibacter sp. 28C]RDB61502.1 hypothetical protein C1878_10730 [Gordonibacter sp. 28C]